MVTSEIQTELSVQVVLPNGEIKALRVLVEIFGCQAVALANPNVFGDQLSEKYESPQQRRLLQADNETPLPGGDEQIDVKIQFTGVVDGSVSLPRVAQYGVSPYLVSNLPWDMVVGHPWAYEHCVSHFARFNCLYSHHPVHPRFWIEDFREAPRTGKPFLVKPIHGKVSGQSVWGITVPIIGAVTPTRPAQAIVVKPPGGEPPNRVEAEKHISYALTASSVAPVQDRACAFELVEFAPETLAGDVLPTRCDGSMWTESDYGLTPYWAARVKKQFGKNPDVDAFNRVPGMAQATRWVSPLEDFFSTPADPSKLYWMCPPYHRFSDCVRKIWQEKLRAIVVGPKWTHREWWKPLMEITLQGYHLPGLETHTPAMCGSCGTSVTTSRAVPRGSPRGPGWPAATCTITHSAWSCACSVARVHWLSVVAIHTGVGAWGRGHRGSGHATSALCSWCSPSVSTSRRMYRRAAGGWHAAPCVGEDGLPRRR